MVVIIEKERTVVMNSEGGTKEIYNSVEFDLLLENSMIGNEKKELCIENVQ